MKFKRKGVAEVASCVLLLVALGSSKIFGLSISLVAYFIVYGIPVSICAV